MLAKNLKHFFPVSSFSTKSALVQSALRHASTFSQVQGAPESYDLSQIALKKQSQDLLVEQPWTTKPFLTSSPLQMPVFNFASGAFTGQVAQLD